MAEIVKACDTSLPARPLVAVKRILPHLCDDEQYRTMFLDESRVLAQLDHPNIIHAFEIGEVDGTPYIAMDYVDGQDARTLFHRTRGEGPVPVAIACHVIASVCDGLHHAHEQTDEEGESLGLVHRDVSLQNVLLSYTGDVKITDFGIAVSSQNNARTEVGIVKGKFGYMSPEQIRGAPLDRRSDVFGAGICLYELLTGERLFVGENDYKAVEKVRNVDIDPPSKLNRAIPSDLERIVMKALARQPRDRFATALDMRRELLSFMAAAGERCTREDLGGYLRTAFATEYESEGEDQTTVGSDAELEAARAALPRAAGDAASANAAMDGTTGLAAFDDLDPVSAVDFDSEVTNFTRVPALPSQRNSRSGTLPLPGLASVPTRPPDPPSPEPDYTPTFKPALVVPPVVPHPDSIPGTMQSPELGVNDNAVPEARPLVMDWDEHEPTTINQGLDAAKPASEDLMPEDEVTGIRADEPIPGLAAAFDNVGRPFVSPPEPPPPPPPPRAWQLPPPPEVDEAPSRSTVTFRMHRLPLLRTLLADGDIWMKVGAGALGTLVVVLLVLYWMRDHGAATIHLVTDPRDVTVRVDGKPVLATSSPFVLSNLDTSEEHTISVDKVGHHGWSTRLRLRPDQVLTLPLIRLEPERRPPTAAAPGPAFAQPEPPTPAAISGRKDGASSEGPGKAASGSRALPPRPKREREPRVTEPRASAAPAASGGTGMLRINTRPWSRVTIDGRLIGNTPQMAIPLKPGKHTVTLLNPEFGLSKTLSVEIKAGEVTTRVVSLQ